MYVWLQGLRNFIWCPMLFGNALVPTFFSHFSHLALTHGCVNQIILHSIALKMTIIVNICRVYWTFSGRIYLLYESVYIRSMRPCYTLVSYLHETYPENSCLDYNEHRSRYRLIHTLDALAIALHQIYFKIAHMAGIFMTL